MHYPVAAHAGHFVHLLMQEDSCRKLCCGAATRHGAPVVVSYLNDFVAFWQKKLLSCRPLIARHCFRTACHQSLFTEAWRNSPKPSPALLQGCDTPAGLYGQRLCRRHKLLSRKAFFVLTRTHGAPFVFVALSGMDALSAMRAQPWFLWIAGSAGLLPSAGLRVSTAPLVVPGLNCFGLHLAR